MSRTLESAWAAAKAFASALAAANLPGYRATYVIGSLPGGYFDPATSDIDLVALFAGERPNDAHVEALSKQIKALLLPLTQIPDGFEMECLPRFEAELVRDSNGVLPNPDLAARMHLQSRSLDGGDYTLSVDKPSAADFQQELRRFLSSGKTIRNTDYPKASPGKLVNHCLALMRFYLAIREGRLIYDKRDLPEAYQAAPPLVNLPPAFLDNWQQVRRGEQLPINTVKELRSAVQAFERKLLPDLLDDFRQPEP